jgi:hypothetical protein
MRVGIAFAAAITLLPIAAKAQTLQDYINHHRALEKEAQWCNMQMNRYSQQAQYNAWHGGMMMVQPPACMNDNPRIIAQMAYDETQIQRMKGDTRSLCQITGVCRTPSYGPGPQHVRRDAPPDNSVMDQIVGGYETTPQGNVRQVGPNGPHHFDCGPGARDVTGQSYMLPSPNCVER